MTNDTSHIILCNSADPDSDRSENGVIQIGYLEQTTGNMNLHLPDFVKGVYHLPDRLLDLLEIASYVFCADRLVPRGSRKSVEYHNWSRTIEFRIRVRDISFWDSIEVKDALTNALKFITGDREYSFCFQPGHSTVPSSLFDSSEFSIAGERNISVILFSGGLDSLAGALDRLNNSDDQVCLVSHQSLQPRTIRTQERLVSSLQSSFPDRVFHYRFKCSLKGIRAREETQRSRSFLYTSVAFSMAYAYKINQFYVYENGVTSMNFARRGDQAYARASRTTHPKSIELLRRFFSLVANETIHIEVPFLWKTKTDVFNSLKSSGKLPLLSSAVSCNKTFQHMEQGTHCGQCYQCVDRRLAAYASETEEFDGLGIYAKDFIAQSIEIVDARTTVVDYIRQARNFARWNIDFFYEKTMNGLLDLIDWIPNYTDENEIVERVWELCHRHGNQVLKAITRMRGIHDDLYQSIEKGSLLDLMSEREYLKEPIERLVFSIKELVSEAIPAMFRQTKPQNEDDLNTKISALLMTHHQDLKSEHPEVSFAGASVIPDHKIGAGLVIESKYIRESTTPSKATDGIAADLTKYPEESHILFFVYDPTRKISNDRVYIDDIETKGRCTVCILR